MGKSWLLASSILAAIAASAASAAAAESGAAAESAAAPQGPQDAVAEPTNRLEEVIVTAERREQGLQSTAVAVSVLQGTDLQQSGRFTQQQILEDVPSVSMQPRPTSSSTNDSPASYIAIRGVTTNPSPAGSLTSIVPAAAYYVDGVLNGIGGSYDIGQVQVLRGPQGTLYGRSATAGAVLVNTGNPELGQFGGDAAAEVGNYNLRHYTGNINIPAGDVVAVRVSGNHYESDGWYARQGARTDSDDGRVKLLFKPSENFSALLGFALQNNHEYSGELTGYLTGTGTDAVNYHSPASPTPLGTGYDQTRQFWAQIDWDLGPVTLTYIPALRQYEQHATAYVLPTAGTVVTTELRIPHDPFHTEELRLASNSNSPWQWQAGIFYYHNDLVLNDKSFVVAPPLFPEPGLIVSEAQPEDRLTENIGEFAESTYSFASGTRVTAGLRGDYTKIVAQEQNNCTGQPNVPQPTGCLNLPADQGTRIWRNLTYKLRVEQDLTPRNLVYASLSSAFLPGDVQVTGSPPVADTFEPETLTAGELGSKNRFLDNRLQVNGDVYYYRFGGHQTQVQIGQLGPAPLYSIMNSPARMVGAELEVLFQPTANDRFGLNASYTDGYYADKPLLFAASVANSHLSGVIPWQFYPSYQHFFALPGGQKLTFSAAALVRSSWLVADIPQAQYQQGWEPYFRNGNTVQGNFSLAYEFSPRASVSAYIRNVSNAVYKTQANLVPPSAPPPGVPAQTLSLQEQIAGQAAVLSEPRTFGVVLNVHF